MRDIRAPSKVTTKTARKAKAACVWAIELLHTDGGWWILGLNIHITHSGAKYWLDHQRRVRPNDRLRIRRYIRQDP